MDGQPIISVNQVAYSRGSRQILNDLNLKILPGKVTAIMGPSGTGKTTLLNIIGGQLEPDAGEVLVAGQNPYTLSQKELYQLRRRLGVLFQEGGLLTDLNVFENIAFPLRQHTSFSESLIRDLVLMNLEAVGLRGTQNLRVDELSGGMARRAALARSIVLGPDIMMYDEPFTGQDPIGRGVLVQLIRQLGDALGLTSVIVSHDVPETANVADYVYIISEGRVIGEGAPDVLFKDSDPAVYQFINGRADGPVSFQYPADSFRQELGL